MGTAESAMAPQRPASQHCSTQPAQGAPGPSISPSFPYPKTVNMQMRSASRMLLLLSGVSMSLATTEQWPVGTHNRKSDWHAGKHAMPTGELMEHGDHDVTEHGAYPHGHPHAGYHSMEDGKLMAHDDHNVDLHGPYPDGHPHAGYHPMPGGAMMAHDEHDVSLHGAYPAGHPLLSQFPNNFDNTDDVEEHWVENDAPSDEQ